MLAVPVPTHDDRWLVEEEDLPASTLHAEIIHLMVEVLWAWIARTGRDALACARGSRGHDSDRSMIPIC